MRFALLILAIVAICVIVGFVVSRGRSAPRSYGDVRKQIFNESGNLPSRGQAPKRPDKLDTRLPAAKAAQLRALFPPTGRNREAFYDCYGEVTDSISNELTSIDKDNEWYELLSPGRRAVILIEAVEGEVNNGGFDQYYLNSSGDGAGLAPQALRLLGQDAAAALVERANAQFPAGPPADRAERLKMMKSLGEPASKAWGELDNEFYNLEIPDLGLAIGSAVPYILKHEAEFFRGE